MGKLSIDEELAKAIQGAFPSLEEDWKTHEEEHSLETQLPFLQNARVKGFVPIVVAGVSREEIEGLGRGIARAVAATAKETLLLASTDLSRYEPLKNVRDKDAWMMERFFALDWEGLKNEAKAHGISMCGLDACAAVMVAAQTLGAAEGRLVSYETETLSVGKTSASIGFASVAWE